MSGLLGDEGENGEDSPSSADETFESVPGTPTAAETATANGMPRFSKAKLATDETLD